jgi:hypothetical protein
MGWFGIPGPGGQALLLEICWIGVLLDFPFPASSGSRLKGANSGSSAEVAPSGQGRFFDETQGGASLALGCRMQPLQGLRVCYSSPGPTVQ